MKFTRYLAVILLTVFLSACLPEGPEEQRFLTELQQVVQSEKNEVLLSEVTDFNWQEVCLFHGDDSEKYSAYDQFQTVLKKRNVDTKIKHDIKKANYRLIIAYFLDEKPIKVEAYRQGTFSDEGVEYAVSPIINKDGDSIGRTCIKKDSAFLEIVLSKRQKASGYIFIFDKKELTDGTSFFSY